ncbi:MAG: ThiF family adenylyltransferase [Pseudomonadota bacterium]
MEVQTQQVTTPVLSLDWTVLESVIKTIGQHKAETGGVMGGNGDAECANYFRFDLTSRNTASTYSPDHTFFTNLFRTRWNPLGIRLRGFIHSHPGNLSSPSYGDQVYAERILNVIEDLQCLWLPIVNTVPDTGRFQLTPWAVYRAQTGVSVVKGNIQVVNAPDRSALEVCGEHVLSHLFPESSPREPRSEIVLGHSRRPRIATLISKKLQSITEQSSTLVHTPVVTDTQPTESKPESFDTSATFNRVENAYDLRLLGQSRLIAVGAGGAADWLENMARTGVGQFVIIDPDTVSETNLATQQTYRKDIGRAKVECIAERIHDINPKACVIALQKSLDDLTDEEIRVLACNPMDGEQAKQTIICGLTDNFFAQARVNRIALQFGLPSLCAQVYKEGRGAEVTFTYPGVTPACHRCVTNSRYRHFLEHGQSNDVTSHGTPIFATIRLNAIKGYLALALLHHGSKHPRWGEMMTRIGNRNLVQLRLDPDFSETLELKTFDRVFENADKNRLFFDETVWLPQKQDCPENGYLVCPDCGGTGDLHAAIGTIRDTRLQPAIIVGNTTLERLRINTTA